MFFYALEFRPQAWMLLCYFEYIYTFFHSQEKAKCQRRKKAKWINLSYFILIDQFKSDKCVLYENISVHKKKLKILSVLPGIKDSLDYETEEVKVLGSSLCVKGTTKITYFKTFKDDVMAYHIQEVSQPLKLWKMLPVLHLQNMESEDLDSVPWGTSCDPPSGLGT